MSAIKLITANFLGNKDEMVAWVHITDGKIPGASRGKHGTGYNPRGILAILDDAGVGNCHMRTVCRTAIDAAEAYNAKDEAPAMVTPPPPAASEVEYFLAHNGVVISGPISKAEAIETVRDGYLACPIGGTTWKPAAEYGIVKAKVMAPPPPPAMVPPPPVAATVEDDSDSQEDDGDDDGEETNFDADARAQAIQDRILAGR